MCVFSHVQIFVTPWTIAHQAPLSMGFSRQEYWNGLPFPSPADLSNPWIEPVSPALGGRFLTGEPPGKPCVCVLHVCYYMVLNDTVISLNFTEKIKAQILPN